MSLQQLAGAILTHTRICRPFKAKGYGFIELTIAPRQAATPSCTSANFYKIGN